MTYDFGAQSSYGYGYNAEIGVLPPQPAFGSYTPGINYYPTSTIGVAPYAPINSAPATGSKPMGYSYGYDGYISHPYYTSGTVPDYVSVTPSNFTYGNPVAPAIEQGSTTAVNPYAPYTGGNVAVTPSPLANRYAPYTGGYVPVTPNQLYNYYQPKPQGGVPAGGAGGGAPSGSGGGGPQPQQQQKQQPPVQIQINTGTPMHPARRSGSGYTGGNTGAIYNPARQYAGNNYGGAANAGGSGQYGQASAGYNAPSIVPYLLIGGIGIAGYMMLKKHHH